MKNEKEAKAWGLFRLRITGALEPFRGYGHDVYIPEVAAQVERLVRVLVRELKEAEREAPSETRR